MKIKVECPYCHKLAKLVDSRVIYKTRSNGMIYYCSDCDAYVGCHRGTSIPLGVMSNRRARQWKIRAHKAFDHIWKHKYMYRSQAYLWLSVKMNIPLDQTHIGMFDVDRCKQVVNLCTDFIKNQEDKK